MITALTVLAWGTMIGGGLFIIVGLPIALAWETFTN